MPILLRFTIPLMIGNMFQQLYNMVDNLLICCINRNGQILTPRGQNIIKVGDTVILVTTNRGLGDIRDILKS